jgi:hypothetical protein
MRNVSMFALAATMLIGSSAFANSDEFEYRCRLDAKDDKGGTCWVRGEICVDDRDPTTNERGCRGQNGDSRNEDIEASLEVRCSNGFDLEDRRADVERKHDDLVIEAERNGKEAKLTVERVFDRDSDEFDATLKIEDDGSEASYSGECRIRKDDHDV